MAYVIHHRAARRHSHSTATTLLVLGFALLAYLSGFSRDTFAATSLAVSDVVDERSYRLLPHHPESRVILFFYDKNFADYFASYWFRPHQASKSETQQSGLRYEAVSFFQGRTMSEVTQDEIKARFDLLLPSRRLPLSDGRIIRLRNLDTRLARRCPQALTTYIQLLDADKTVLKERTLLYVLEPSVRKAIQPDCASDVSPSYQQTIVALGGGAIDFLNDGTVFVTGPTVDNNANIIVRIKADLTIKDMCSIPGFVIADTKRIRPLFAFEDISYQELQDDVMKLYLRIRQEQCQ